MKQLLNKICKIQSDLPRIKKDANNPFHKSKYTSLDEVIETIKPFLHKEKLALISSVVIDPAPCVETKIYDVETGDFIVSTFPLIELSGGNKAQSYGSVITYARRYNITALLNLHADDDDGNSANKKLPNPPRKEPVANNNTNSPGLKMAETKFKAFLKALESPDPDNAKRALKAVKAKGAWNWSESQELELQGIGIDPYTMESRIPFE